MFGVFSRQLHHKSYYKFASNLIINYMLQSTVDFVFLFALFLSASLSAKVLIHLFLIGNEQLILTAVIRHLDHKNILHDPQTKSDIIQTATSLAQQLRSQGVVPELAVAGDLCRHLRKTLEALESASVEELNLNESLQKFLEGCLLEVVRGVCPTLFQLHVNISQLPWMFWCIFLEICNCATLDAKGLYQYAYSSPTYVNFLNFL
jgi:hypothetical protein